MIYFRNSKFSIFGEKQNDFQDSGGDDKGVSGIWKVSPTTDKQKKFLH